jgi:hypothetical protein
MIQNPIKQIERIIIANNPVILINIMLIFYYHYFADHLSVLRLPYQQLQPKMFFYDYLLGNAVES